MRPRDGGSEASARIIPVSDIEHEGEHPEGDPKDDLDEERRALGTESPEEDIEHGRPIDPLSTPVAPVVGPPSKPVLIGNNPKPAGKDQMNTDLPVGLEEARALFESWTKGQDVKTEITRYGVSRLYTADGTQLRINADGGVRIDRPRLKEKQERPFAFKNGR